MALSRVGGDTAAAIDGADVTMTSPVGIAQNDVIWAAGGEALAGALMAIVTTGYTTLATLTGFVDLICARKVQGATPDSTVVGNGQGGSTKAVAYAMEVWRGVDTTTPEDATTTTAEATSGNPDPAAIVTATDGAVVIVFSGRVTLDNTPTFPTGYSNTQVESADDTVDFAILSCSKVVAVAGSEDPAAISTWPDTLGANSATFTVAVKPAAGAGATEPANVNAPLTLALMNYGR